MQSVICLKHKLRVNTVAWTHLLLINCRMASSYAILCSVHCSYNWWLIGNHAPTSTCEAQIWNSSSLCQSFHLTSLPNNKISMYYLRSRAHNLTLTSKSCFYDNCNFITRMLFKGTYWSILTFHSLFYMLSQSGLSLFSINEHDDDDGDVIVDRRERWGLWSLVRVDRLVRLFIWLWWPT